MKEVLTVLISWFPMILIIAVWMFFMRRVGMPNGFYDEYFRLPHDALESRRGTNRILLELCTKLDRQR